MATRTKRSKSSGEAPKGRVSTTVIERPNACGKLLIYKIKGAPNRHDVANQVLADGDPFTAGCQDTKDFLQSIADIQHGSVTVTFRNTFEPAPLSKDPQDRLTWYILVRAKTKARAKHLALLIEAGTLARFFRFERVNKCPAPWRSFRAACHVVRRETVIHPSVDREFNPLVPALYWTIRSFLGNEKNDLLNWDRICDRQLTPFVYDVGVAPVDVSEAREAYLRYLDELRAIGRLSWTDTDDGPYSVESFLDDGDKLPFDCRYRQEQPKRQEDPLAEDILRAQRRFQESLALPHVLFNIRALAVDEPTANHLAAMGASSAFLEGSYRLISYVKGNPVFEETLESARSGRVISIPTHEEIFQDKGAGPYKRLAVLASVATVDELKSSFRFPIASHQSPLCFRKDTDPTPVSRVGAILVGRDATHPEHLRHPHLRPAQRYLKPGVDRKSLLVTGMTGSGKTTCLKNLALNYLKIGIPFIIVEATRTDYRSLKVLKNHTDPGTAKLVAPLQVYTIGDDDTSPLQLNSFEPVLGISRDERVANLSRWIDASVAQGAPLNQLIEDAIERVIYQFSDVNEPPTVRDLYEAARHVLDRKNYKGDIAANLQGALETRLKRLGEGILGRIFQCRRSVPDLFQLVHGYSILELDRLKKEHKAVFTLSLINWIHEYLKVTPWDGESTRLMLFLEEAQLLVGASSQPKASETVADPQAYVTDYVEQILQTFRGLGCGLILSTQYPLAISERARKTPCTHFAFLQKDKEERALLRGAMGLTAIQEEQLLHLGTGDFFLMTEGLKAPCLVHGPSVEGVIGLMRTLSNEELLTYIRDEPWFINAAQGRCYDRLDQFGKAVKGLDERTDELGDEARHLLELHKITLSAAGQKSESLGRIKGRAKRLQQKLAYAWEDFECGPFRYLVPNESTLEVCDPSYREWRDHLIDRVQSIKADINEFVSRVKGLAARCATMEL